MRDFLSGVLLLVIAGVAVWQASDLTLGTLRHMGPGLLPLSLAVLIAVLGVALIVTGGRGKKVEVGRFPARGPILVLGSAVAFAVTIQPLGLAVAGPLVVVVSAFASEETRWIELLIFGVLMTVFCLLLFKVVLALPIPVAPWLLGY